MKIKDYNINIINGLNTFTAGYWTENGSRTWSTSSNIHWRQNNNNNIILVMTDIRGCQRSTTYKRSKINHKRSEVLTFDPSFHGMSWCWLCPFRPWPLQLLDDQLHVHYSIIILWHHCYVILWHHPYIIDGNVLVQHVGSKGKYGCCHSTAAGGNHRLRQVNSGILEHYNNNY